MMKNYLLHPFDALILTGKTHLQSLFFIVILLLFAFPGMAQVFTARPGVSMTALSNGFYEYLPEGYSSGNQKYPLLIFFHGAGERGNGTTQLSSVLRNGPPKLINEGRFPKSFTINNQTFRFIVIAPQMIDAAEVWDTDNIINYCIEHYRIDTARIYLTGLSMGGGTCWYYPGSSTAYGNRIAAIVPVCGACWPAYERCENIAGANLNVWATHNSADGIVPSFYTTDFVNTIDEILEPAAPLAKMTIFNASGHDAWTQTYDPNFKENGLNVYEWMLQYSRDIVLPVRDLKFEVALQSGSPILHWTTTAEQNNAGFSIERSIDGTQFDSVGYVSSQGAAGGDYVFRDNSALQGENYYRLKQTDRDGEFSYSEIKVVTVDSKSALKIFPNPATGFIYLNPGKNIANGTVQIIDAGGKVVLEQKVNGSSNIKVVLGNIPSGLYILQLTEGGQVIGKQRFIEK